MKLVPVLLSAALLAVPVPALAAAPVEVTYDDAVKCAALDTTLAIVLSPEEGAAKPEDQRAIDYYSGMADKWLAQASAANPGGEDATMNDIVERSTSLLVALSQESEAGKAQFDADFEACTALEEAAYGGPNGIVD